MIPKTCPRALTRWVEIGFRSRSCSKNTPHRDPIGSWSRLVTRHLSAPFDHVLQYVRTFFSGDDLRRKPWAGDRLRGRRLSAAHRTLRTRYTAVPRSPPSRSIALHDPASGAGHSQNSL